ncbi:MAG TPA: ATP synthase F1 subunit delta [Myxococcales bacterium]|nr:ATP synthase F1 subunit delta [Myxococcales bacterium]
MIHSGVARRYARALLSLGLEEGRFEQYGDELEAVLRAMRESKELQFLVANPGYAQPQRQAAVDVVASALNLSPVTVSFLRLIVDRERGGDLPAIARAYRAMVDQHAGRIRASVTAARPLDDGEIERLRETIGRMTGRSIVLEAKTDPSLIGGAVTQVGATQFDGSLRTQLERMRDDLKARPIEILRS